MPHPTFRFRPAAVALPFAPRARATTVAHPLARRARTTAAALLALGLAGCGARIAPVHSRPGLIALVGAESQYANVLAQIGGRYVSVAAVMDNPNTDPHSFEASPSVARTIASARLIVQNGLGYDAFMNKLESASSSHGRRVIDVQKLLRLPDSTSNPHLWYSPTAMARVAAAAAAQLAAVEPSHAAYFAANLRRFRASLTAVYAAIGQFRRAHLHVPVATTEPVANYLLRAIGARILTPWSLQADLMNGVDPAPQDLTAQDNLLHEHRVRVIVYNRQVTDPTTQALLQQAAALRVPEVAVYETMPAGYSYQSWMLAELHALTRAVTIGKSTTSLA